MLLLNKPLNARKLCFLACSLSFFSFLCFRFSAYWDHYYKFARFDSLKPLQNVLTPSPYITNIESSLSGVSRNWRTGYPCWGLCDEASDSNNKDQLYFYLRYIDENNAICENFLKYIHCQPGLAGKDLYNDIISSLESFNLQICRGQGYDGAEAVAGKVNGLAVCFQRKLQRLFILTVLATG